MNACPPFEKLEMLLADKLGDAERDVMEAHVESCSSCQQQLDSFSSTPSSLLRSAASSAKANMDISDAASEPNEGFVERLRQIRLMPATVPADAVAAVGVEWLANRRMGQYEFMRQLGKGGMGAVYLARHVELGKTVAVKVLPAEQMNEMMIARFKREIRAIGQLDHPNIVTAHDAGEQAGVHYLVMSLVDGVDLRRILERRGKLPIADACEAARQAALGLQHAIDRGLVHRDVKPSNLMVTRDGLVKLVDLGLSRSVGDARPDTLTVAGTLLGTADYLAPEQWDNPQNADTRADIYGLGCTLFHLLTGQPPFAAEEFKSVLAKMRAHHEVPPPAISRLRPDVPAELVAVINRMVAKKPADRFGSPAEVAAALRPFVRGANLVQLVRENSRPEDGAVAEPVEAAATSGAGMWETDADSIRRRPAPPARGRSRYRVAIAAACLLLIGGAVTWLATRGTPMKSPPPLTITDLHVVHYRDKGNLLIGDLEKTSAKVFELDDVRVSAQLSAPGYAYLIAFNPRGAKEVEQLCYPEDELGGIGAPTHRPEPKSKIQYPRATYIFQVEPAGLQAFVLAVATKPLPPYQEWRANVGKIPWQTDKDEVGFGRWFFDGKSFARIPRERGRVESKEYVPESFEKLCRFFRNRSEFDSVQAIAFSVSGDQK
jgi:serine/threonine protein kinase